MNAIDEIRELESRMQLAELGPDPVYFEAALDDRAMLDGVQAKRQVVEAHRPTSPAPKFTRVEMSDFEYIEHGPMLVVVKCTGTYESPKWSGTLKFQRVWFKKDGQWKIVAGSTLK
jgi:hypothetical protein